MLSRLDVDWLQQVPDTNPPSLVLKALLKGQKTSYIHYRIRTRVATGGVIIAGGVESVDYRGGQGDVIGFAADVSSILLQLGSMLLKA